MELKSLEFIEVNLADQVAELRITRPKALNALNRRVLEELSVAIDELAGFESLSCLIITGGGDKAFVAGADVAEMNGLSSEEASEFAAMGHAIFDKIAAFPTPVIAAVHGYALGGGCELALACDIIYASEKAKFGQPEVKLGLIPGFGGSVRLPRKIGLPAASEWIYTAEIYSAEAARKVGLVQEVLPPDELLPRVRKIARLIAGRAPLAIRAAKKVMHDGMNLDQPAALKLEQSQFAELFTSEDTREGTQAFVDKRDPNFKGK